VLARGDSRGGPLYPTSLRFKAKRWIKGPGRGNLAQPRGRHAARRGLQGRSRRVWPPHAHLGTRGAVGDPDGEAQRRHAAMRVRALRRAERGVAPPCRRH
jgi:hypothetical protein